MPLIDKLEEVLVGNTGNNLLSKGYIKCIPVNFTRGLTFKNACVIIDEAQNMTNSELTTILPRFGVDSKYIVVGLLIGELLAEVGHDVTELSRGDKAVAVFVEHLESLEDFLLGISVLHLTGHHGEELREVNCAVAVSINLVDHVGIGPP